MGEGLTKAEELRESRFARLESAYVQLNPDSPDSSQFCGPGPPILI